MKYSMKFSYNNGDFVLVLSSEELGSIRYALGNEVTRQQSNVSYLKCLGMESYETAKEELEYTQKVSDELEKIVLEWARMPIG